MFKNLHEKSLIVYREEKNGIGIFKKIEEAKISENVIDLLVEKVKDLSLSQAETLKLAACIGDSFQAEILF